MGILLSSPGGKGRLSFVEAVVIVNLGFFFLTRMSETLFPYLALRLDLFLHQRFYWTVLTYAFVHGDVMHITLNLLVLAFIGPTLEEHMGTRRFALFYLICGVLSGLLSLLIYRLSGTLVWLIGASGAIYATLFAFAVYFPRTYVYFMGIIPVRAPFVVLIYTIVALFSQATGRGSGVAHWTHLSGFLVAYIYLFVLMRRNPLRAFFVPKRGR